VAAGGPAATGSPGPSTGIRSDDASGTAATEEVTATPGSGDGPAQEVPGPDVRDEGGAEHTDPCPNEPRTDAEPRDPWERFGWVMSSMWLLFLGFPIAAGVAAEAPVAARVATIAGIAAFGALYVIGFVRGFQAKSEAEQHRTGLFYLAALTVLALATIPVLGVGALGMTPFLVAFSMFMLSYRSLLAVTITVLVVSVAAPVLTGTWPENGFFTLIVLMVAGATGVVRILTERGHRHREAVEELRLVAERDRMARDVHDVLGHSLTVISMKAELADRLVDADPAQAHAELAHIQSLSRQALAEIRATIAGMRVARLADELEHAGEVLGAAGIDADLPTDATEVDPRHRIVLAWVLREAVTNVVRHSGAQHCRVEWGTQHLSVTDDGVGITGQRHGQGLRGIRERVRAAGGTVQLGPGDEGRGTALRVHFDTDKEYLDGR